MPAERLLREVFGLKEFLPFQKQIINLILRNKDVLAVLPTASGKSLCFQIPALLRKGTTIVVSPLIALMKDQIDRLREYALPVEFLNSSLPPAECQRVLNSIRSGDVQLIYISPERLRDSLFLHAVRSAHAEPPLWVVDEAHCITEWGHDFRTDYLFIPDAIDLISKESQLILFTATATPLVREDILRQMRRPNALTICAGFDRPNLYLGCRTARTKVQKLRTLQQLLHRAGPGIIYAATRRQCENVNRFLQESGFRADFYHAGRSAGIREEVHEKFMANELEIVVATNAFGMGLNKPDIRYIIHYAHPGSIDAYYQEIGRGGRDGGRCDCILLFSPYDRKIHEKFIMGATPSAKAIADFFAEILTKGHTSGIHISRPLYEENNIELFELEKAGILERQTQPCGSGSLYLTCQFDEACVRSTPLERKLLRALDLHFRCSETGSIKELDLYSFSANLLPDISPFLLEQSLLDMADQGIIVYHPESRDIRYRILTRSVTDLLMEKLERSVMMRRQFKLRRLDMMASYGMHDGCLREYLLSALGDSCAGTCNFCDNC